MQTPNIHILVLTILSENHRFTEVIGKDALCQNSEHEKNITMTPIILNFRQHEWAPFLNASSSDTISWANNAFYYSELGYHLEGSDAFLDHMYYGSQNLSLTSVLFYYCRMTIYVNEFLTVKYLMHRNPGNQISGYTKMCVDYKMLKWKLPLSPPLDKVLSVVKKYRSTLLKSRCLCGKKGCHNDCNLNQSQWPFFGAIGFAALCTFIFIFIATFFLKDNFGNVIMVRPYSSQISI